MKVIYDYQIFIRQKFGGISRVFYEMYKCKKTIVDKRILVKVSDNYYLKQLNLKIYSNDNSFKGKFRLYRFLNKLFNIKVLKHGNYDVFHPTYYDTYFLKYNKKPFVLTVHDMIHEQYIKEDLQTIRNKKCLIEKADKIVAISENTKKDILNLYNIDSKKIEVIYWANSLTNVKKIETPTRYILYVGGRNSYKNFKTFFNAVVQIFNEDFNLHLLCAGGNKFNEEENNMIKKFNLNKRVKQIDVTDEELTYLYQHAIAFIYPSKYEGFGIPILEAFYCKCPVILSNTSCFPEIAKDAAVYFDPDDIDDMKNKIISVIYNDKLRKELINKGFERNKDFSWEKTVKEYDEVYRSLI